MLFLSDADARPPGAAHPLASLWDNGDDPIAMLRPRNGGAPDRALAVGLASVTAGTPLSLLEAKTASALPASSVPASSRCEIDGRSELYVCRKNGFRSQSGKVQEIVSPARQRDALAAVLETIKVEALAIPPAHTRSDSSAGLRLRGRNHRTVQQADSSDFRPDCAAAIAADLAVSGLLDPNRAAR